MLIILDLAFTVQECIACLNEHSLLDQSVGDWSSYHDRLSHCATDWSLIFSHLTADWSLFFVVLQHGGRGRG